MTLSRLMNPDEQAVDVGSITTEHIMPVVLGGRWRDELTDSVGSRDESKAPSGKPGSDRKPDPCDRGLEHRPLQRPFSEKKEKKYYWDTELAITNALLSYDQWGFEEINRRSRELLNLVKKHRLWTIV